MADQVVNVHVSCPSVRHRATPREVSYPTVVQQARLPQLVDYTASKGGVEQITKSAAVELGTMGITVNCVAPGAIMTERTREEGDDFEALWTPITPITPMRRIGQPEDFSAMVLFLIGEGARFVTGQTIWVDGGAFARAPWPYAI